MPVVENIHRGVDANGNPVTSCTKELVEHGALVERRETLTAAQLKEWTGDLAHHLDDLIPDPKQTRTLAKLTSGRGEDDPGAWETARAAAFAKANAARAKILRGTPVLRAEVTYLPAEAKPICVSVTNPTGADVTINVEREAEAGNPTDAKFTAKAVEGETTSTVKFYEALEGRNTITVTDSKGAVLANRIIEHKALDKMTKGELTELATEQGIETNSRTTKAELLQSLADG